MGRRDRPVRQARVHRIPTSAPDDVSGLHALVSRGEVDPARIVAVLGKTEGNGCVNDFTRGFATAALKAALAAWTGRTPEQVERETVFVMSGGTEGGLSPHLLVFEVCDGAAGDGVPRLAIGTAVTRRFAPHEIGRMAQIEATAEAVRAAMASAEITDAHYVQVKCPLLTKARIAAATAPVVTADTLKSMAFSRGASALGVGLALGEFAADRVHDDMVCRDLDVYSTRASTSAGVELEENQVMVLGNSTSWSGDLVIAHDVMGDAIDAGAVSRVLAMRDISESADPTSRVVAVLAKAEASSDGLIRGARHTMLDDSDIAASRHARALVGGVLAGALGTTTLFVSGGAEHQGPDGGGPLAIIARRVQG